MTFAAGACSKDDLEHTRKGEYTAIQHQYPLLGPTRLTATPIHPGRRQLLRARETSYLEALMSSTDDRPFVAESPYLWLTPSSTDLASVGFE